MDMDGVGYTCSRFLPGAAMFADREAMRRFPYYPDYVFENLGEFDPETIVSRRDRVENGRDNQFCGHNAAEKG